MTISIFDPNGQHPSGIPVETYVKSLEQAGNLRPLEGLSRSGGLCPSDSGNTADDSPSIPRVALAGGGLMGCSITAAFLRKSIPILLYDTAESARTVAPKRIAEELACQLSDGMTSPSSEERIEALRRTERLLTVTSELADLDRVETILETIVEKAKIKQKFYRQLDSVCSRPKRLLTNTSTIEISELARGLEETVFLTPERFCGFHFFHPVRKRSLVEIIRGRRTAQTTLDEAGALGRSIEKSPILVADGPGFLVNRLLNPYLEEAMTLLLEGTALERIEAVCGRFGMEMGPFRIMDEIGLDVTLHSGWTFYKAFPEFVRSGELLPAMMDSGRLGRKNGHGFMIYETSGNWDGDGRRDESLSELLGTVSRFSPDQTHVAGGDSSVLKMGEALNGPNVSDEMIAWRIFTAVLMEGIRIIEAGIVPRMEEADRALDFGLGFPKKRGGIAFWADGVGLDRLIGVGRELARLNPKFTPPKSLVEAAHRHAPLVAGASPL